MIALGAWLDSLNIPPKRYGNGPPVMSGGYRDLQTKLADWEQMTPGAQLMVSRMRYLASGDPFDPFAIIHPDDVREALLGFGLDDNATLAGIHEKAVALGGVNLPAYWRANGWSRHSAALMQSASYNQLKSGLPLALACTPDLYFNGGDLIRKLPTIPELQAILADCPSKRYQWRPVFLDCDDHVRIIRGWLSAVGLGDIAIAAVEGNMYRPDGSSFAHAWCVAALADGSWVHVEPADCQIKPANYSFNGADRNEIYRVEL